MSPPPPDGSSDPGPVSGPGDPEHGTDPSHPSSQTATPDSHPDSPFRIRLRGIYATALTNYLADADRPLEVVRASPAIDRRFDREFAAEPADATVEMTADRYGVEVRGERAAVSAVEAALLDLGIDAFSWTDVAAPGAVFGGTVAETTGGGAIVSLDGDREGFLPFDSAEGYVDTGDDVRVQVAESRPPWEQDRPVLATGLRIPGDVVSLVAGVDALVAETPDGTPTHELVRTTELLSTTVPDDWGIVWRRGASDLPVAELDAALGTAVDRARSLESALESAEGDGLLGAPVGLSWTWFGRSTRFALDDLRDEVTPTLPGHHRTKAGDERASGAVDFAEHLGVETSSFPFDAVVAAFGPAEGDRVSIEHGKPDGRTIGLGRGTVTGVDVGKRRVTVERTLSGGGTYDALDVPREAGDVATTRFTEGRWWYPTVYRGGDGDLRGTYVNVSTPVEVFPDEVRYVDLHVDVVKHADGTVETVDEDVLAEAEAAGTVTETLATKARDVANQVAEAFEG
ncbi:MAG: DUF402 domain-containing protein [Halanaeroarchaeum sp.]